MPVRIRPSFFGKSNTVDTHRAGVEPSSSPTEVPLDSTQQGAIFKWVSRPGNLMKDEIGQQGAINSPCLFHRVAAE